ncbi:MAG: N-acetylmuramoyl-L-alanine amidase [Corallococcus sp.]|nr:N-acetylmuramoyl-L-alanine amidase [Corallococcus sp.]
MKHVVHIAMWTIVDNFVDKCTTKRFLCENSRFLKQNGEKCKMTLKVLSGKKLAWALAVLCAVQLVLTAYLCVSTFGNEQTSLLDFTVVIDAGHGGIDGGVVGFAGTRESDLNLQYAATLGEIFKNCGFNVVYTRTDKGGLYGTYSAGFKRRDMEKRKEIILASRPDIVISVHMNKFGDSSRSGPQVFFQEGRDDGKRLADSVQLALNKFTGNSHAALRGDFYVTRAADAASIIVECGFLSNPDEEQKLNTEQYMRSLTEIVFEGVMLYLYSL